ncbi:70 kDa peptidylprolyl isomerase, partial [Reticulomyxa filosa]
MSSGNKNAERGKSEGDGVKNLGIKDCHYEKYTDENWPEKECYKLTKDGEVRKIILKKSSSTQTPKALGRIWMNVKGKTSKGVVFEDLMFEERDIILGQGEHCKGVEMAVVTMNVGDHCVVEIGSAEYSYRNESLPRNCPKNNDQMDFPLTFEVILVDCMLPLKSLLGTSFEEQFQSVQLFREKGNQRYEKKRYLTAMKLYEKVE